VAAGIALATTGYWNATRDPIIRTAAIALPDWPADAPPMRVVLISDIHVAGPDMPPARVSRIVAQLNALKPDLVLIAGDLISQKSLATRLYTPSEIVTPLRGLRAKFGTIVALGNHDYWAGPAKFRDALSKAGIMLLANEAVKRGTLVVGGVDDKFTGHTNIAATYRAMDALPGPRLIFTHDPDIVPDLPAPVAAVLAGHTHCGQINKPWSGEPIRNASRYGMRFQCGDMTDRGQRLFVTAGLGTSVVPFRFGAPPDAWLITFGPSKLASARP
jgi:uncharacterized protein